MDIVNVDFSWSPVWRSVKTKSIAARCMTVTRRCRREQRFLKYPVNLRMHWAFSSAPLTWASVASADNLSAWNRCSVFESVYR